MRRIPGSEGHLRSVTGPGGAVRGIPGPEGDLRWVTGTGGGLSGRYRAWGGGPEGDPDPCE